MAFFRRPSLIVLVGALIIVTSFFAYTAFFQRYTVVKRDHTDRENPLSDDTKTLAPDGTDGDRKVVAQHTTLTYHPDVKVVSSFLGPDIKLPHEDCVPLPNSPKFGVRICLNPVVDDHHVSGALKSGNLWEANLISEMTFILKSHANLQVVDLGCNIGEYTLWAAAMGRPVLAVEMLESNIRLVQKSLEISQLSPLVTLVNNAVYSDHRQLETLFLKGNLGGTRLNTSSNNDRAAVVDLGRKAELVNTICVDDLIPLVSKDRPIYMKIDVENSEHKALAGAHKFFKELDVRYVQMEWLARTPEEIKDILSFMNTHGYLPSRSLLKYTQVDINVSTIPGHDVYFIKKEFINI